MYRRTATSLGLLLAVPLALAGCQPPPEPAPPPKPAPRPPTVTGMAVEACENAVLASFRANPAHRSHDLVFDPQARKSVPVRSGQLAVTGMGSYASTADRLVRVNYTCSYDVKAEVVLNSSFR